MRLKGKVALVTGGGTGIGKAIAKAISDEDGKVIIVGRKEENLKQTQNEIGSNIEIMVCDVTNESQVLDVYSTIINKHGKLDILINNAGMAYKAKSHEMSYESWKKVIDVNLNGAFLCAREAMKIMVNQKSGRFSKDVRGRCIVICKSAKSGDSKNIFIFFTTSFWIDQ